MEKIESKTNESKITVEKSEETIKPTRELTKEQKNLSAGNRDNHKKVF
jgi:hypothetical protein